MNVRELRIGNIVTDKWNSGFITVNDINSKGINLEITDDGNWPELACHFITPEYDFEELRGIELTEEVLLECGGRLEYENVLIDDIINVNLNLKTVNVYVERMDGDANFDLPKYLHQFQNLIFALTNKEIVWNKKK